MSFMLRASLALLNELGIVSQTSATWKCAYVLKSTMSFTQFKWVQVKIKQTSALSSFSAFLAFNRLAYGVQKRLLLLLISFQYRELLFSLLH